MGQCYGKTIPTGDNDGCATTTITATADGFGGGDRALETSARNGNPPAKNTPARSWVGNSSWSSPYPYRGVGAGGTSPLPEGVSPSPARYTPRRFFKKPFPPLSPAKHIKASLVRRVGHRKTQLEGTIQEDAAGVTDDPERHQGLDKYFGYNKNFGAKYELGKEVGRGHFGHTCYAKGRKGELKDLPLAIKIISKSKVSPCYA